MASKKRSRQEGEGNGAIVAKKQKAIDKEKALTSYAYQFIVGTCKISELNPQAIGIHVYFKKRYMAWEILKDDGVRYKMVIQFANIVALKIDLSQATFQIRMNDAPKFLRDVKDEKGTEMKRSKWEDCEDFTDGRQASIIMEHTFMSYTARLELLHRKILEANSDLNKLFNWPLTPMENGPNSSQALIGYPAIDEVGNRVAVAGPINCVGPSQFPPIEPAANYPDELPADLSMVDDDFCFSLEEFGIFVDEDGEPLPSQVEHQSDQMLPGQVANDQGQLTSVQGQSDYMPAGHVENFVDSHYLMGVQDPCQVTGVQSQSHQMTPLGLLAGHAENFVDSRHLMGVQDQGQVANGFVDQGQLTGVQGQSYFMGVQDPCQLTGVQSQSHQMTPSGLLAGHVENFVDSHHLMGVQDQGQVANGLVDQGRLTSIQGQSYHMGSAWLPVGHMANYYPHQLMGVQYQSQVANSFVYPHQLTGVQSQSHHMESAGHAENFVEPQQLMGVQYQNQPMLNGSTTTSNMELAQQQDQTQCTLNGSSAAAMQHQNSMFSPPSRLPPLGRNSEELDSYLKECIFDGATT